MITDVLGYTYEGSCVQNCTGVEENGKIIDPKYCNSYYICQNNEARRVVCPSGTFYNPTDEACTVNSCPPNNQHRCIPTCTFDCQENQPSAHRSDCTKYYLCGPEGLVEQSCLGSPNGPYWDGTQCQENEENCCDPCMVHCSEGDTFIADPLNCDNYYFCDSTVPLPYFPDGGSTPCSSGQFSVNEGYCSSSDSSCIQLCEGGGGGTCKDDFTCPDGQYGVFAACEDNCSKYYYYCTVLELEIRTCNGGQLLNPDTLFCVDEEDCPYPVTPWVPPFMLSNKLQLHRDV